MNTTVTVTLTYDEAMLVCSVLRDFRHDTDLDDADHTESLELAASAGDKIAVAIKL